jgi:hypothetical protein
MLTPAARSACRMARTKIVGYTRPWRGLTEVECRCTDVALHQEYSVVMLLYRAWIRRSEQVAALVASLA